MVSTARGRDQSSKKVGTHWNNCGDRYVDTVLFLISTIVEYRIRHEKAQYPVKCSEEHVRRNGLLMFLEGQGCPGKVLCAGIHVNFSTALYVSQTFGDRVQIWPQRQFGLSTKSNAFLKTRLLSTKLISCRHFPECIAKSGCVDSVSVLIDGKEH